MIQGDKQPEVQAVQDQPTFGRVPTVHSTHSTGKTIENQTIATAAKVGHETMSSQLVQTPAPTGLIDKFWSWFGYSTQPATQPKEVVQPEIEAAEDDDELPVEEDEDDAGADAGMEGSLSDDEVDDHSYDQIDQTLSVIDQTLPVKEDPVLKLPSINTVTPPQVDQAAKDTTKPPIEETTAKTNEAGKGWLSSLFEKVRAPVATVFSAVAHPVVAVNSYLTNLAQRIKTNKASLMAADKAIIENFNGPGKKDPQMLEFVEFISQQLVNSEALAKKMDEKLPKALNGALEGQNGLIFDLIEINVARGFANLLKLVNENKANIPNYDSQPSLLNVLSFLSQRAGARVTREKLEAIRKRSVDARAELAVLTKKLLPEIETKPEQQALLVEYAKADISFSRKGEIFKELFPDDFRFTISRLPGGGYQEVQDPLTPVERIARQKELDDFFLGLCTSDGELKELFGLFADDVLECLFPNKKIVIPEIESYRGLSYILPHLLPLIYNFFIKDSLVDFLVTSYKPIEKDPSRTEGWEKTLKGHMGVDDLHTILEAPTALALGLTKNYIQTNPKVVSLTAGLLASMSSPSDKTKSADQSVELTEEQKREKMTAQLSKVNLANWIVESVQALLHTEDKQLNSLGSYFQDVFTELTLGVLAKGMSLVIPEGVHVDENHFVEQLLEGMIEKFKALKGQPIDAKQFWKDFLKGLNLPPIVQEILVDSVLAELTDDYKKVIDETLPEIEKLQADTIKTIKEYKNGNQLFSIIEKITDQIIGKALKKNIDLVAILGLEEDVEVLLDQYLPGLTIDKKLKDWLKRNLKALSSAEDGLSPQSVDLLKQGVQAVLSKAMINTIESNFDNDSGAYAAQLLKSIHEAFGKAFADFNEEERKEISQAIAIQEKITSNEKQIAAKKKNLPEKPRGLTEEQQSVFDGVILSFSRYLRASNYVRELRTHLANGLAKLKPISEEMPWKIKHLRYVSNGLMQCKINADTLKDPEKALVFKNKLMADIEALAQKALDENDANQETARQLAELEIFNALLAMDSAELQLISDALSTADTLRHAEQELEIIKKEQQVKKDAFLKADEGEIPNREQWDAAIAWTEETAKVRKEVEALVKENERLLAERDQHLGVFQVLSRELMALLGLETKEKLDLPSKLADSIWPHIETATKEKLPGLLFANITNVLLPVLDLETNRNKLKEMAGGDESFLKLAKNGAAEIIKRIPQFVTSYKPFAKSLLSVMGVKGPISRKAVERMENALQNTMIQLGRKGITGSMFVPHLKGIVATHLTIALKGIVPKGHEKASAESIAKLITKGNFKEFTKNDILPVLNQQKVILKDEEEKALEVQTAEELAHELNLLIKTLSDSLAKQTAQTDFSEFSKELLLPLLKDKEGNVDKKLERRLEDQAGELAKDLNYFLMNRGKAKITNRELLETYRKQRHSEQPEIKAPDVKTLLRTLEERKLVKNIKKVVITPEEIAEKLNGFIPGAEDLHQLISSQVQEVIMGKDQTFIENRGLLQDYIEGMFIRVLIRVLEANSEGNQPIFDVIARKIKEMKPTAEDLKGKKPEEVARSMIDKALIDIANINSSDDFKGLLLPLQEIAYEQTKEIFYQALTPIALPIIERAANREILDNLSGSKFLGSLSEAISKDAIRQFSARFSSYRPMAAKIYTLLNGAEPTPAQLDEWTKTLMTLRKNSEKTNFTNQAIVEAYAKLAGVELSKEEQAALKAKLKESKLKEEITKIVITPEEIVDHLQKEIPSVIDPELRKFLVNKIQNIVHDNPASFEKVAELVQSYMEGVLVQLFIHVVQKEGNQPVKGKDSFLVMIERLLDLTAEKLEASKTKPFEQVAKEFNDDFFQKILGIDSPDAFDGLPSSLKPIVYKAIQDKIGALLIPMRKKLRALEEGSEEVNEAKEGMKKFGMSPDGVKSNGEIFVEDLAKFIVITPAILAEKRGEKSYGVHLIFKELQIYLEELSQGGVEIAKLMLNYSKMPQLEAKTDEILQSIADPAKHAESKEKATELIKNWLAVPMNKLLNLGPDLEEKHGPDFDRKLMTNVLGVVATHLRTINQAKEIAGKEGRTDILHKDFIAAAGDRLHPAVPKKAVDYQQTLDEIFNRLLLEDGQKTQVMEKKEKLRNTLERLITEENKGINILKTKTIVTEIDAIVTEATGKGLKKSQLKSLAAADEKGRTLKLILREEAAAPKTQRKKEFYSAESRSFLKVLFPNGKKDLTYVTEDMRGTVWKLYKENLFPAILPMLTDLLFEPDMINSMVLNALEATRNTLNEKIVVTPGESAGQPLDPLDEVSGELMVEMLKMVKLPGWVKGQLIDPTTGEMSSAMKKSMGSALRGQFNGAFIQKMVTTGLQSIAKRNPETGDYAMRYDTRPREEKLKDVPGKRKKMEKDLHRVSREVINSSISYYFRNKWATAQARFDRVVEKAFGKVGRVLKRALDAVFRFIFLQFIGTVLSLLLWPLKRLIQQGIYSFASLDGNAQLILDLLRKAPPDQPSTDGQVVFHEDMVYKMIGALHQTMDEIEAHA